MLCKDFRKDSQVLPISNPMSIHKRKALLSILLTVGFI